MGNFYLYIHRPSYYYAPQIFFLNRLLFQYIIFRFLNFLKRRRKTYYSFARLSASSADRPLDDPYLGRAACAGTLRRVADEATPHYFQRGT